MKDTERTSGPASSQEHDTSDPMLERPVTRRGFMKGFGRAILATATFRYGIAPAGAVAAGMKIDSTVGKEIAWGDTEAEIIPVHQSDEPGDFEDPGREAATFCFTGLGRYSAEDLATALKEPLRDYGDVTGVQNSNEGLNPAETAGLIQTYMEDRNRKVMNFYAESYAPAYINEVLDEMAPWIDENNITIGRFWFDCSPYNAQTVRTREAENLAYYQELGGAVPDGPVARFLGELAYRTLTQNQNLVEAAGPAWKKTQPKNCSTELVEDQAHSLLGYDGNDLTHKLLRHNTKTAYFRPTDASQDTVVQVIRSYRQYNFHLGGSLEPLQRPGIGHAQAQEHPEVYKAMFEELKYRERTGIH